MDDSIVVHQAGRVRRIVLNRPDKLNAITTAMGKRIFTEIDSAVDDDDVGVIVISGAGRAFSAGADLHEGGVDNRDVLRAPADMTANRAKVAEIMRLWAAPKPVIAQVHGYCIGSANDIVAIADLIVCGESARFGMPEARQFALPPTLGFWPFRIGLAKTKELLYTGRFVGGTEAAAIGLAATVVADDSLAAHVDALAATIAEVPADRLAVVKQAANSWFEVLGLPQAAARGAEYHALYHQASEWAAQGDQRSPEPP
ncbi:MAG TPA: enoyl-CoA hydratase-related protein [Acidimicrobiales bacterium]|jgi:enoyl-CoA hydratase|nr:enoyl-CoA hydratase-related protein [Acidimicrobiales bacterium]